MDNISDYIRTLYSDYDFSYLTNKYIDKNYWLKGLKEYFSKENIENLTDFNYSKCFTYHIDLSSSNLRIGTKEFKAYLSKGYKIYRLEVMISLLGPYISYHFFEYSLENGSINLKSKTIPFVDEHKKYIEKTQFFSKCNRLIVLTDDCLKSKIEVPSYSSSVSIYNLLFENSETDFPY